MKKYVVVLDIDQSDGVVSAWVEMEKSLITTMADSIDEAVLNIRMLIQDFIENEWKDKAAWQNVNASEIEFDFEYSLMSFFEAFKSLKIGEVAKLAGMNPALLRAYAVGDKNASLTQAQKIETAAHKLATSLLNARVVPFKPTHALAK